MEYGVQGGLTLTLGEDVGLWSMEFRVVWPWPLVRIWGYGVWSTGWFDLDPGWGCGVMEYGVQGGLTLTLGKDVGLWSMEYRVVWPWPWVRMWGYGVWSSGWFDLDPGWGCGVMEYGVQGGLTLTLGKDVGLWSMEYRVVWPWPWVRMWGYGVWSSGWFDLDPGWGCGVMEYGVQGGLTLTLGEDVGLWSIWY